MLIASASAVCAELQPLCSPARQKCMQHMLKPTLPAVHYSDSVFAPVDLDHQLERIAGGNETEVYVTDDRRFVVKLKSDLGGDTAEALACARAMRAAAERFVQCLGAERSIPSFYVLSRDERQHVQVLVIQPFVAHATPLFKLDYAALSAFERAQLAHNLREIICRALAFYRSTGSMPDLYGRASASAAERRRAKGLRHLPRRVWSFVVERNLLRSHNLLFSEAGDAQVVLVDYDIVRRGTLYKRVYFAVRRLLFWRDRVVIRRMERGGGPFT